MKIKNLQVDTEFQIIEKLKDLTTQKIKETEPEDPALKKLEALDKLLQEKIDAEIEAK